MTAKQLQLVQEIEQKFKELQATLDGDKYITAFAIKNNFSIETTHKADTYISYYNGKEVWR